MKKHRIYTMSFASIYPLYLEKAKKKGRTNAEVDEVLRWLTGYTQKKLESQIEKQKDLETFIGEAPMLNSARSLITGVICGVRIEEIQDPLMREIRYMDKLIDELAKGRPMEKILRKSSTDSKKPTSALHSDIQKYHAALSGEDKEICEVLAQEITRVLPNAENKVWHAHPVWFLEGNPIVGYDKMKENVRLLFWSGQSFEEKELKKEGSFKAAEIRYTEASQINKKDLKRWLKKAQEIQWDYKNIVKRKGVLKKIVLS